MSPGLSPEELRGLLALLASSSRALEAVAGRRTAGDPMLVLLVAEGTDRLGRALHSIEQMSES
jgi:hypothetical protein